ncbi:uncharacterized protein LOC132637420 [Lycium barbarum]|uniref:uncharacterized protein LOC132637420 n=1 Tax=Lycium barbarum TaxID=112863 RepID=UPI00293E4EE4|nr:uncharacterized protein LOC132637420 [Lycium barbarum]
METFQDATELDSFRRRSGHQSTLTNCTGKIWLFVIEEWEVHLVENHDQHLTVRVVHQQTRQEALVSAAYASCDASIRRNLWDSMIHLAGQWQIPWLVGGDFNMVLFDEVKLGGLPVLFQETEDFAACINDCHSCINDCHLYDLGYIGSTFTWWNGRSDAATIFKRLDRILSNQKMIDQAPQMTVTHLIKKRLRPSPLELQIRQETARIIKPFKFLNFWIHHATFNQVVFENWTADFAGNLFLIFQHKLKKLRRGLVEWSKESMDLVAQLVGYLNSHLVGEEEVILAHESQFDADPSMENRAQLHRVWLSTNQDITAEAVNFYSRQFAADRCPDDFNLLKHIPIVITEEHNHELVELPSEEEIKSAIFGLSGDSASGPDGFTGCFFQHCSNIVEEDIINMVRSFFVGYELPKFIAHTNLVLRKFGFSEIVIDMVFRLVSSNWYSVLINGQTHAKVLSRSLNALLEKDRFKPFGMPKWSPLINHLSYADDTILFLSAEKESVKLMMKKIQQYEEVSGQLVNLNKSVVYVHHKVSHTMVRRIMGITKIRKGSFPFTYLCCAIYYGRNKIAYYDDIIKKIGRRIQSWNGKMLSYGGRAVLISNVPQSMPLHILSVMSPPIGVIRHIHRLPARFSWNYKSDTRCRHWIKWEAACLLKEDDGLVLDMSNALFCKLWWSLRTKPSLWASFMITSALYHFVEENHAEEEIEVKQFNSGGEWNLSALREQLSEDIVQHIVQNISPPVDTLPLDKTWWMLEQNGINIEGLQLSQVIIKCWKHDGPAKVHKTIWQLVRVKFSRLAHVPPGWPELVDCLETWRLVLHYKKIICQEPAEGHIKINTDRAIRGNTGPSSYGFCCRNHN